MPWLGHYVASKHAVTGMAKTLANELGEHDIRVMSLHPNAVTTHMGTDTTLHGAVRPNPRWARCSSVRCRHRCTAQRSSPPPWPTSPRTTARFMTGTEFVIDLGNLCR